MPSILPPLTASITSLTWRMAGTAPTWSSAAATVLLGARKRRPEEVAEFERDGIGHSGTDGHAKHGSGDGSSQDRHAAHKRSLLRRLRKLRQRADGAGEFGAALLGIRRLAQRGETRRGVRHMAHLRQPRHERVAP